MDWIYQNYEWIIGAILIPIIAALVSKNWAKSKKPKQILKFSDTDIPERSFNSTNTNTNTNTNSVVVNNNFPGNSFQDSIHSRNVDDQIDAAKGRIKILFIDDDTKFKVVTILKKAGWVQTKSTKDIYNLDDSTVKETDIFFVDIQGVGKALDFRDEGLGLALALKRKYPQKKLVIYSSESQGDRFHEALRNADSILSKNAEPYEFQNIVEQFSIELLNR